MRALMWVLISLVGLALLAGGAWFAFIRSVETPAYRVIAAEGPYELRDYPAHVAAEVHRDGGRETAVGRGFGPLAGYIFAKTRPGPKIAMTAPVTQVPDDESGWRVRFIMPAEHSKESLPTPANADVRLVEVPAQRIAAVRFSGRATDPMFEAKTSALRSWLSAQGYATTATPTFAYYDDPSIPGLLRRNEVLVPVRPTP